MFTRAILVLALSVPAAAIAEDMYRWRDARGRVHYSNDTEKVPEGAVAVTKQLGHIGGDPIGEAVQAPALQDEAGAEQSPPARWTASAGCVADLGLIALPHRAVDFDRRDWFDVDRTCGPQHDVEGWLRRASTRLELRKIGL
jgi:hypothetical protein